MCGTLRQVPENEKHAACSANCCKWPVQWMKSRICLINRFHEAWAPWSRTKWVQPCMNTYMAGRKHHLFIHCTSGARTSRGGSFKGMVNTCEYNSEKESAYINLLEPKPRTTAIAATTSIVPHTLLNCWQTPHRALPHATAHNGHASYLSMAATAARKCIQRRMTSHMTDSSLATQYRIMRMCFCSVGNMLRILSVSQHPYFVNTHVLEVHRPNTCQPQTD